MKDLSTRQIMNRIYKDICGFKIPKIDEKNVRESKGSPVYGEITHQSVNKLLDYLNLGTKDIFFDLGSGVGKVVLQTALITPIKKAIGIELSEVRHKDAISALEKAMQWVPDIYHKCEFRNADLMTQDLSQATVIYSCSTAFSLGFMKKITKRLAEYTHKFRVITLQDLPDERYFTLIDKIRLDMSWIRSTQVFIYKRK
jgi:ribosomal protein L16/L10AE